MSEFTTDVCHVASKDYGPTDAISRNLVASLQPPLAISWDTIATVQIEDTENVAMTFLTWAHVQLDSRATLLVDHSTLQNWPYVPA